jgi:hypothetical protein
MERLRIMRPTAAGALFIILTAAAPLQRSPATLIALKGVEQGQWQLKDVDGAPPQRLCITNPSSLLQLRHGGAQCSQFVIENSAHVSTIRYTCPGHGYGQTTITVETPRLVRVDTQGVLDGAPFAVELEGRRTGVCG